MTALPVRHVSLVMLIWRSSGTPYTDHGHGIPMRRDLDNVEIPQVTQCAMQLCTASVVYEEPIAVHLFTDGSCGLLHPGCVAWAFLSVSPSTQEDELSSLGFIRLVLLTVPWNRNTSERPKPAATLPRCRRWCGRFYGSCCVTPVPRVYLGRRQVCYWNCPWAIRVQLQ